MSNSIVSKVTSKLLGYSDSLFRVIEVINTKELVIQFENQFILRTEIFTNYIGIQCDTINGFYSEIHIGVVVGLNIVEDLKTGIKEARIIIEPPIPESKVTHPGYLGTVIDNEELAIIKSLNEQQKL